MCGIAGILVGRSTAPIDEGQLWRMAESLRHRGPDAAGVWRDAKLGFAHTRLSIIDLSAAANQPMLDATGRYILVFNGEIFNHVELREELRDLGHTFRTQSDSEVILAAYREWNAGCLQRFNGMWAFAIWDTLEQELFASRDRAGKKPFYYVQQSDGSLMFASEVKALRSLGVRFGVDPQAAFDFLTQGTYGHLGANTFFSGLRQLPAAHMLRARPGGTLAVSRYWELPVTARRDRLPYTSELTRRFRDLFVDAVRVRLRADVPVGATLSGGLDSSAIVGVLDQLGKHDVHLFTRQYPGTSHDESQYVDAVVKRLHRPVLHVVPENPDALGEQVGNVMDSQEEPFGDTSILAHNDLMRAARAQGIPVILSGQGGDELLLGYPSMVHAYLGHLVARGSLATAWSEISDWSEGQKQSMRRVAMQVAPHVLPLGIRDDVRTLRVRRLAQRATPNLRRQVAFHRFQQDVRRGALDRYIAEVFTRFALPHLTHYDDRNAMMFSVEGRMPFLDYRLVELAFSVEYSALLHGGFTKRLLRESCSDFLPDLVRQRRDKIGFFTPLARWLRANAATVRQATSPEYVRSLGVMESAWFQDRLAALMNGDDSAHLDVWRGFILHVWASRFEVSSLAA